MSNQEFQKGDVVEVIVENYTPLNSGDIGEVLEYDGMYYDVSFKDKGVYLVNDKEVKLISRGSK